MIRRIGIVGCGAIGSALAKALQRPPLARSFRLAGVHDLDHRKASTLAHRLRGGIPVLPLDMLIRRSDLIVEATAAASAGRIVTRALAAQRDVLCLSVGGLLPLSRRLPTLTRRGGHLYVPSGAIAGVDAIKAARLGTLRRVTLTTRKSPASLVEAPGARRFRARLRRATRPITLFRGSAAQAVRQFPQNINVAATLALAGLGAARTEVRIVADPRAHRNLHEIEAAGSFGRLTVRTENVPSRQNPKTSELAVLSALATLHQLAHPWRVGT